MVTTSAAALFPTSRFNQHLVTKATATQDDRDANFIEVNRTELFCRDFLKASNLNQQYLIQEAEIDLINEPNNTEELEISQTHRNITEAHRLQEVPSVSTHGFPGEGQGNI